MERTLGRALAELGCLPNRSPLPFRDAQLASGCVGSLRECGARVAAALDSEQLLVSALQADPGAPTARLTLYRFEAEQLTKSGSAVLPLSPVEELELTVRALAESVFGSASPHVARPAAVAASEVTAPRRPEPSASYAATSQAPAHSGSPALRGVGWTAVGLGAAGAIGAIATAISASNESDAYARAQLQAPEDVDRALRRYDRAQHQSDIARVLGGVSAGVVAAGAFMLCWEYFHTRRQDRNLHISRSDKPSSANVRVAAWPQRTGAMVALGVEL
ncbi:MAG TPA: hypothetical protein VFZ61_26715 [Polyangiales bacterium]